MASRAKQQHKAYYGGSESSAPGTEHSLIFGGLEGFFNKLSARRAGEITPKLSTIDWLVYLGVLLVVLVTPFLYSRETTENFLTPKEFFSKIALVLLGGIYCTQVFLRRKIVLTKTSLDLPLVLFFGFASFSVLWNYNALSAIRDLRGVFMIMLLFPLIVNVVRSRWQLEFLLWAAVLAGIATSTIGIMETYNYYFKFDSKHIISYVKKEVLNGKYDPKGYYLPLFPQLASKDCEMGSIVSTFGNRNYLGTFAMFTAFVPLAFFFYYKSKALKIISLLLYGWMLFGVYITRCRAALIGIAVGIAFMFLMILLNDKKFKLLKKHVVFFVIAVLLIFCSLFVVSVKTIKSTNIFDKIKSTFTMARSASNTFERMWVWYATIQSFNKNASGWLFGLGLGSFKHFFPYQEPKTMTSANQDSFASVTFRQAHNDWLQLIAELGITGLVLFLFLVYRFFAVSQSSIRRCVFKDKAGEMDGDSILLIALGAGMISQLLASLPDFPFHRIETALYSVLYLSLVPVLAETGFFKHELNRVELKLTSAAKGFVAVLIALSSVLSAKFEKDCWKADTNVRSAEMYMRGDTPECMQEAKLRLNNAIMLDPLPGDPYLKLAQVYAVLKDPQTALALAEKSFRNINFNARSTYHSIVFRKMHIYYYILGDLKNALSAALHGLDLTCGDARSIFYMHAGKIACDITNFLSPQDGLDLLKRSDKLLTKAADAPQYAFNAKATQVFVKARLQDWGECLKLAREVSNSPQLRNKDPNLLNLWGIAASNLGYATEAIDAMQKAAALAPQNAALRRDLGIMCVRANNLKKARENLEAAALLPSAPASIKQQAEAMVASITMIEISKINALISANKHKEAYIALKGLAEAKMLKTDEKKWVDESLKQYEAVLKQNYNPSAANETEKIKKSDVKE